MFIRTKDEIIKSLDADYMCGVKVYHTEKGMITEKLVLKEADTIEELCDEFIGLENYKDGHQLLRFIPYKCSDYWNGGVYGAIWTDKGLIFVAKMNEKGELELI